MRHNEIGVSPGIRRTLAFVLVCLPALFVPASAADDLCGTTIVADLILDRDLTCGGNGLTVGADGIDLDLNGYSIAGLGTGFGITVTGRTHVTIVGGTIRNFATGVLIMSSTDILIQGNQFQENVDGIDVRAGGSGNTIKENAFLNSSVRGIMLRSATVDNLVKENTFSGNRVGILVNGAINSTVQENFVSSSGLAGIRVGVTATGNLIKENTVTSNPTGIDFIVVAGVGPIGNAVVENTITLNGCGVSGGSPGNTFKENVFKANGVDTCGP